MSLSSCVTEKERKSATARIAKGFNTVKYYTDNCDGRKNTNCIEQRQHLKRLDREIEGQ